VPGTLSAELRREQERIEAIARELGLTFFRVIFDRRLSEPRSHDELVHEIQHAHALHAKPAVQTPGHPPVAPKDEP